MEHKQWEAWGIKGSSAAPAVGIRAGWGEGCPLAGSGDPVFANDCGARRRLHIAGVALEPFIGLRRYRGAKDQPSTFVDAIIVALGLRSLVNDAEHGPISDFVRYVATCSRVLDGSLKLSGRSAIKACEGFGRLLQLSEDIEFSLTIPLHHDDVARVLTNPFDLLGGAHHGCEDEALVNDLETYCGWAGLFFAGRGFPWLARCFKP